MEEPGSTPTSLHCRVPSALPENQLCLSPFSLGDSDVTAYGCQSTASLFFFVTKFEVSSPILEAPLDGIFASLPKCTRWNSDPLSHAVVFGGVASGSQGGRVPMKAIASRREETAGSCHPFPRRGDTARRRLWEVVLPRRDLGLPASRTGRNQSLIFYDPPSLGAFVTETRLERPRNPLSGFCSQKSFQSFTVKYDDSCVFRFVRFRFVLVDPCIDLRKFASITSFGVFLS